MKSRFFKFIKIGIGSLLLLLLFVISILYLTFYKKIPEGKPGTEADLFALKIQDAVKHNAFIATDHIEWTFAYKHHYLWHKKLNEVVVKWDDYTVLLLLNNSKKSTVYKNDIILLKPSKKKEIIKKAQDYFNNDSFWLVAPHKLFDTGVTRKLVTLENDTKGLLISYSSGGSTPGDSYLWKVDKNYLPTSYQMWVSIIPIGGLEATWSSWTSTQSGAYLSTEHKLLGFGIPITNLKAWNDPHKNK